MIDEPLPGVFRIEAPLPGNPLKSVNCYLFKGRQRHVLVDTGMNRPVCREAIDAGLAELGVERGQTDFFVTHYHADHMGLVGDLATPDSTVYMGDREAGIVYYVLRTGGYWPHMAELARLSGFPDKIVEESLQRHPGVKYSTPVLPPLTTVRDGEEIEAGAYRLQCIETPGHTHGHMCLYEPQHRFLVAGDHVLGDITPNISAWTEDYDPLDDYLASLDKVSRLDVSLVLPGHRRIFTNLNPRIEELKHHHRLRAEEAWQIVAEGPKTAYQIAAEMKWDIVAESWERFPAMQKWFAAGEALAHARYLENGGRLRSERRYVEGLGRECLCYFAVTRKLLVPVTAGSPEDRRGSIP